MKGMEFIMNKKIIAAVLLAGLCLTGCGEAASNKSQYKVEDVKITNADEALERLKDGNKRFVEDKSELINVTKERREQLEEGQSPYAVVVSCSDSRVTPTALFNVGLGELFDIRVAGNVLDKDALGSIEYGVEHLKTPLLVIMGHESCGAVTAAYDKVKKGDKIEGNINSLVDKIEPSVVNANSLDEAIHNNTDAVVKQVNENEVVKELVKEGKLKVVEAYYTLDGNVTFE